MNLSKNCLFFLLILCKSFLSYSQNIQWQNTIGGNDHENLFSIELCHDGNYILGGFSYSNISGDKA